MANHGKRMVREDLIKEIGQGGGSEYTAGNGIDITNNEISVDETVVQGKLTAGSGISIENDVISATGSGSGASFTDWLDFGDSERYTITEEEYNQLKNGEKRLRYRARIYEVCHIITEPDWEGFTGLRLESSAAGVQKIDAWGEEAKIGNNSIKINGPDMQDPYAVSYGDWVAISANTSETPNYTLSKLRVGDLVYSVGGGSSETTYGSKDLTEDTWDNLVQNGMTVLTSESIANGTEFIIDGVVGIEYQSYKVVLYNATSHSNAFLSHNFGQPIRMRKTNFNSYKIVDGYLNTVISPSTLTDVTEEHAITNNEGSTITYQINASGAVYNPVFVTVQRDAIALNTRYLDASATERKVHTMLDIPRTTAGDYVLSCSTDGSNITELGWKTPQGGGSSYTAGNGINITNNAIAIDPTVVARLNASNTFKGASQTIIQTDGGSGAASAPFNPIVEILANKGYSSTSKSTVKMGSNTSSGIVYAAVMEAASDGSFNLKNDAYNGIIRIIKSINNSTNVRGLNIFESEIRFSNNGYNVTVPEKTGTLAVTTDITNTIPECPTTSDGTYVLEATVSNGEVVYNWVLKQ